MGDNFRFVENIARGGFGVVDKVQLTDGSMVARKSFAPINATGKRFKKLRKRFVREVRTQARIKEGVIPVLDHDLDSETPWFLMPLAERTFRDALDEGALQSIEESFLRVLDLVDLLHKGGYIHRDLKPENILCSEGDWYLADFGLVSAGEGEENFTSEDSRWGSRAYSAPEIYQCFGKADHRADIYSLGCILHDMYSEHAEHRVPYKEQSTLCEMGPVIRRATSVQPRERFGSVAELKSVYQKVLKARDQCTGISLEFTSEEFIRVSDLSGFKRGHSPPKWFNDKALAFVAKCASQDISDRVDEVVEEIRSAFRLKICEIELFEHEYGFGIKTPGFIYDISVYLEEDNLSEVRWAEVLFETKLSALMASEALRDFIDGRFEEVTLNFSSEVQVEDLVDHLNDREDVHLRYSRSQREARIRTDGLDGELVVSSKAATAIVRKYQKPRTTEPLDFLRSIVKKLPSAFRFLEGILSIDETSESK